MAIIEPESAQRQENKCACKLQLVSLCKLVMFFLWQSYGGSAFVPTENQRIQTHDEIFSHLAECYSQTNLFIYVTAAPSTGQKGQKQRTTEEAFLWQSSVFSVYQGRRKKAYSY